MKRKEPELVAVLEPGSVPNVTIRKAAIDDAEDLARLIEALGYPTAGNQMRRRLDAILGDDDYDTLVACHDQAIVGLIGTRIGPLYEDDHPYGQIMVLAVAPGHQRRGVGRMLVHAAESNLAALIRAKVLSCGNTRLVVTQRVGRSGAIQVAAITVQSHTGASSMGRTNLASSEVHHDVDEATASCVA